MSKQNDGGPAFPFAATTDSNVPMQTNGMSLRDWYRGEIIKGLLANPGGPIRKHPSCGWGFCNVTAEQVVAFVDEISDLMLAAREARNA